MAMINNGTIELVRSKIAPYEVCFKIECNMCNKTFNFYKKLTLSDGRITCPGCGALL